MLRQRPLPRSYEGAKGGPQNSLDLRSIHSSDVMNDNNERVFNSKNHIQLVRLAFLMLASL
jgi:hypothetical protein